ncbi:acyltransferase [Pseudoalteromonas sp. MSK9-3]|uniref:acyltransferase family protein n=1 Tax=Pseudoalteromonas sp. MSK9-3 TaxID=1897633 RepID=UPI000E6C23DF|nr:acyltransferase [Pseudoalteromonas sp. MSK9-3]RJE72345.1 acyltransferase [Pseudoalteromonas sp. MSK9-3]
MEIRKLNALRGLAASIVLITHFSDVTGWLDGALGGRAGQYGVMLFFLLSGFLMSHLYFDRKADKENIKRYVISRIARVVPLYVLVVICSYSMHYFGYTGLYEITEVQSLIAHLLFVYGESVLWTIAPEIQFYVIFIGLWKVACWRRGYIYVIVTLVLIILFFSNFPRFYGDFDGVPYNFFHLMRSLPYFLVGVLIGMHYKSANIPLYLRKNIFVFSLILIPLMYPHFSPVSSDAKVRMWLSYEVLFVMAAVFVSVVCFVPDNNRLLSNRAGDFLGKISYSLYLLHMPIIQFINTFEMPIAFKLILFLSSSVCVAYLSFRWIEKPAARLINSFFCSNGKYSA